jgi:hypothetical protein
MEHERISPVAKVGIYALIVLAFLSAMLNIYRREVPRPCCLVVVLTGLLLLVISKASLFKKGRMLSFGSQGMSEPMTMTYRLGYWFILVGVLLTFA